MLKTSFLTDSQALEMPPKLWFSFPLYFGNYKEVFELAATGRAICNSLFIAVVSTAGVLFTSSLAAFAFAKLRFPGEKAVRPYFRHDADSFTGDADTLICGFQQNRVGGYPSAADSTADHG